MLFGHLKKTTRNSTLRLVSLYLILILISSIVLLSFIYWSIVSYIYTQLDQHIEYDRKSLQALYVKEGENALIDAINERLKQNSYKSIYLLHDSAKNILAGNLHSIPKEINAGWKFVKLDDLVKGVENHSARVLVSPLANELTLINGLDIESTQQQEYMIFNNIMVGLAIVLLFGAVGGYIFSFSVIKKINLINDTIHNIEKGDLSLRIPVKGTDDEYDLLSENINQMLDQIQKLMSGMKNISNNIAHDLRTPLTRIRGRLESIQQKCPDEAGEEISLSIHDTDSLLSTFNAMLRISNVESGSQKGSFTKINVNSLLKDVISFYEPVALDKNIEIRFLSSNDEVVFGDKDMLFQVFANLLDNAIKYSLKGSAIEIKSSRIAHNDQEVLKIGISDNGVGILDEEKERVFEPFYRAEKHRNQEGNGLGLSLVKAILNLHKSTIQLNDNNPGLEVVIELPIMLTKAGGQ